MEEIVSVNPATEEVVGRLKITTEKELKEIIKKAKRAQNIWSEKTLNERVSVIEKTKEYLEKNLESIAELITKEMGKPLKEAKEDEVNRIPEQIDFFIKDALASLEPEKIFDDKKETSYVYHEPVGVLGMISAWNYPMMNPLWTIIPALLAGNTVVFKPSELTPLVGLEIGRMFEYAGLPENCFNVIIGKEDTGKLLVKSDVDIIAFIGSVPVGKEIYRNSSEKLRKLILELGGKNPALVFSDVDLNAVVKEIVRGALRNAGQTCSAIGRVYVEEKIAEEFTKLVVEKVEKIKVGNGLGKQTDIGPLVSENQLKRIESLVEGAKERGAKILCGGKRMGGKGYFFQPTVLTNVNHDMRIMKEETFGPIIPIKSFRTQEEVIKLANDSEYGLTAAIFCPDLDKAKRLAEKIKAGTIGINKRGGSRPGCPWGGFKQSGVGRLLSKNACREFTETKHVWIKG